MQLRLGAETLLRLREGMGGTHPGLDRPKGMLNGLPAHTHHQGSIISRVCMASSTASCPRQIIHRFWLGALAQPLSWAGRSLPRRWLLHA
jgi:hypothetical protein